MLTNLQIKQNNFKLGKLGESRAVEYLKKNNFRIIATNLIVSRYEIDIVALDIKYKELVFVEVKNRTSTKFGHPSIAVSRKKLQKITCAAQGFMRKYPSKLDYRFDIVTITGRQIEHYENVSWNN